MVIFLLAFIIMLTSFRRSRLGIAGSMGESMLADLSDRIQGQGVLPDLPAPWHAESVIRSAGGTRFSGDFFVVGDIESGRLDVSVVDVSGKGDRAGTRALLLAGAMGGLVTAVEPGEFLPATNAYLLNHPWQDGFATAVHLSVDLASGAFRVWTAGHPPALHWRAGAGRWTPLESEGPMLGLIPDADFHEAGGMLRSGDALMLYTDGMVETRTHRHRHRHRPADRPGRPQAAQQLRRGARRPWSTRRAAGPTTGPCCWSGATEPRLIGSIRRRRAGVAP